MRILILGGTGMIGHALWKHLFPRIQETFVAIRRSRREYDGCGLFNGGNVMDCVDVNDFAMLTDIMKHIKPDFILNCIGITKRRERVDSAVESISLNALLPHRLVEWGRSNSAKVVNFSTDCVFNGTKGNYTEESIPDADDLYGRTKALGEIQGEGSLTLRSSYIGEEIDGKTELLEWFLSQKGIVNGFKNAIYSGLTTIELGRIIEYILINYPNITGLYNISSEPISKYDLLALIKKKMQLNVEIVPNETFRCDRRLDSSRFRKDFNYKPPHWGVMAEELCKILRNRGAERPGIVL